LDLLSNEYKNIYLFHDQNFLANFFLRYFFARGSEVFLIEDGLANYNPQRSLLKAYRYLAGIHPLGMNKRIKSIFLFKPELYLKNGKNKIEKLESKYIKLTGDNKYDSLIKNVFCLDDLNIFDNNDKVLVLITQPLDYHGIISVDEQYAVYDKIIRDFNGSCYLKKHPQDKNEYKGIGGKIINGVVPAELLIDFFPSSTVYATLYSSTVFDENIVYIKFMDGFSSNKRQDVVNLINYKGNLFDVKKFCSYS